MEISILKHICIKLILTEQLINKQQHPKTTRSINNINNNYHYIIMSQKGLQCKQLSIQWQQEKESQVKEGRQRRTLGLSATRRTGGLQERN